MIFLFFAAVGKTEFCLPYQINWRAAFFPPIASAEKVLAHPRVFRSCLLLMGKLLRIIVFQAGGLQTTAWLSLSLSLLHCCSVSLSLYCCFLYCSGSFSFFLGLSLCIENTGPSQLSAGGEEWRVGCLNIYIYIYIY